MTRILRHVSFARAHGYTLMELVMVLGILSLLLMLTIPVSLNFLRNQYLTSDRHAVISLLEWARDQSLMNANQSDHGVKVLSNSYVGFVGTTYATRDQSKDIVYPKSVIVTASGTNEVVFTSLNATATSSTISLANTLKSYSITVNQEGTIDW